MFTASRALVLCLFWMIVAGVACQPTAQKSEAQAASQSSHEDHAGAHFPVQRTPEEWQRILPPKTFEVMRHEDTERAFSSPLHDKKTAGIYYCASCGQPLFESQHKYDSGTGWPSFYQPMQPERIGTREDNSLFVARTEVHCSRCGGHLGHVFDDGPEPTGLRYCMNGAALSFRERGVAAPPLLQ